mgnify:CR=1 FL=1
MNQQLPLTLYLKPGERIPQKILDQLKEANAKYSKSHHFPDYKKDIRDIFGLKDCQLTEKYKHYLAGFVEGEGSLNVGAKKNTTSRLRVYLDPEFSVTQHVNGVKNLYAVMCELQTGRIRHKTGSNATLILTIDNRRSLVEKVLPFYQKYILPFGSDPKKRRYDIFVKLLDLFDKKAHLDYDQMVHEILPLYDEMRCQKAQSNQIFTSLQDAQDYVKAAEIAYRAQNKDK